MSQGSSNYPISQFLTRLLEQTGHTRNGLVFALGYRNLERGRRRLDAWIDGGDGYNRILSQIKDAFPSVAADLERALAATREVKTVEAEAVFLERCKAEADTFIPFVHAEGEVTVPRGICIFGMTGGHRRWTRIEIPAEVLDLPVEEQLTKAPELMLAYKQRYGAQVPFFGRLTGFKLLRALDYFQFDSEYRLLGHVRKPFRHGECSVALA